MKDRRLSIELKNKESFSSNLYAQLENIQGISKKELLNLDLFIQNELKLKNTRIQIQSDLDKIGDLSGNNS